MRGSFLKALADLAGRDPRILLLTADLGYMAVEPFSDKFPGRFFNVGVAEQNMVGIATGLAEAGFIPFAYSIITFASLRPYEFIRNGPILHGLPVRIAGVGGGFEYGHGGPTHFGLEDIGVMRVQPGITVIAPADRDQARSALLATWDLPGPVFYRLGKDDKTVVPGLDGRFELGRAQLIHTGDEVLIIAMGSVASEAAKAASLLASRGVSAAVMVVASVRPAPVGDLADALSRFKVALAVEEHYVAGGLGSMVSEVIAEKGIACRLVRCGIEALADGLSGSLAYLRKKHGLSSEALADRAIAALKG